MSGLEVVAAVAAVVSAFHGGSELLKHIRQKRRQARQARQEVEEDLLQTSLETGEKQINSHYEQDVQKYGDIMRIGDVVARERLQQITILMQSQVIEGLQMAARYENAVFDVTLLHEASIMNRKDTIVTLDQLKQRLLIRMPISRQLEDPSHAPSFFTFTQAHTGSANPRSPDNIVAAHQQRAQYLPDPRRDPPTVHRQQAAMQSRPPIAPVYGQYSDTLRHAMDARGDTDSRAMHEEIDEIMDAYQGLQIRDSHQHMGGQAPQIMLNARFPPSPDPSSSTRNNMSMPSNLPPTPDELRSREQVHRPLFNNRIFGQEHEQAGRQQPAQSPFPQMQTQAQVAQLRWSTASGSSSTHSNPHSLDRNSSTSSHDSHTQNRPPLNQSVRTTQNPSPHNDGQYHEGPHAVVSPNVPADRQDIAPLSPQDTRAHYASLSPTALSPTNLTPSRPNSFVYSQSTTSYPQLQPHAAGPFSANSHQQYIIAPDHDPNGDAHNRTQYDPWPVAARAGSSGAPSNSSSQTVAQQNVQAPVPEASSPTSSSRHASVAPSIASVDSNSSTQLGILPSRSIRKTIRTDTIQSGGSERMMNGRACKANNYWGFCKGAWDMREEVKKGLALRCQPSGYYNNREVWECKSCSFRGSTFRTDHPTKKGKEVTIWDPRIQTSASGVRYKWIFLAKSHVKKRSSDNPNDSNYGCIICSLEDRVSSIYGGVETLMNHIALSHVASLSENTSRKAKCIIGRTAGPTEHDWDINIPVFAQVEELA